MATLFIRLVKRLNQLAGLVSALLILYMAVHILLEIGLRFFDSSTYVLNEFVGYAVATLTFTGLGFTLERGGLIRVDMLVERLSPGARVVVDVLVSSTVLLVFSWLSWYWWLNVSRSYQRGISSDSLANTPLWIPEGMVLIGMLIFCLTLLARVLSLLLFRKPPLYLENH